MSNRLSLRPTNPFQGDATRAQSHSNSNISLGGKLSRDTSLLSLNEEADGLYDLSYFEVERFDPKLFVQLSTQRMKSGEEALRELQARLSATKEATSRHLKKNVYKHYNEFIVISKEISKFESDMIALKGLFIDMKVVMESILETVSLGVLDGKAMRSRCFCAATVSCANANGASTSTRTDGRTREGLDMGMDLEATGAANRSQRGRAA